MKTDESLIKIGDDLKAKALALPVAANALVVTNDQELTAANEFVKGGMALMKEIQAGYDDIIKHWNDGHKATIAKRDQYLNPVGDAVKIVKNEKMAPYMEKQARKVREAEEARRKAQEEAEEAERKAEEERQRFAREALQDGDTTAADEILAKSLEEVVPEIVDIPVAKILEGTHVTRRWVYEVINIDAVPRPLLMLDRVAVNKIVQEKKENARIPGIRVFQKTGISSGG